MSPVRMSIAAALAATGGTLLREGAAEFCGVSIDSRQLRSDEAFVAIKGPSFDGGQFCAQAAAAGAAAILLERAPATEILPGPALLQVADTRQALADLARSWRRQVAPRVVGVTGSVGKTTTKELVAAIAARLGPAHVTPGNFNNDIGLPLTLLGMDVGVRFLVAEMGMSAPGEIAALTAIAEPDVGLITCVAPVHLEGLGSLEAIAAAKAELLRGAPQAWAVVPGDEPLLVPTLAGRDPARCLTFGPGPEDDVRILRQRSLGAAGSEVTLSLRGRQVAFTLPLPGLHNVKNAAAAAAVGLALGADAALIAEALSAPLSLKHRSVIEALGPFTLYDDCYNANPLAVTAALEALPGLAGAAPAVAVLGGMLELGPEAPRYHQQVGARAAALELALLVTVGPLGEEIARGALRAGYPTARLAQVQSAVAAADVLIRRAPPGAWILVKASRGARLEQLIERLRQEFAPAPTAQEPRS